MLSTILKPTNKGKIKGKIIERPQISFRIEGENFYEGKLVIDRLSLTSDIIPFTISEKLVKSENINFEPGEDFSFSGELRSYNKIIENKSRLILSFFVKEVHELGEEEDKSLNDLSLTGYICKPPVYRTTPFNRQICDILLAVNRPNFGKSDYIPCILWGRNAKFLQSQPVGTKVNITGRIQSRIYKKEIKPGIFEERTAYEVSGQKIELLENDNQIDDAQDLA